MAEYSTIVAASQDAKVSYLTADHLGSPRINTDQYGAIIARHDYHPFGEEIDGTGGRTTGLNYGDDTVRQKFTGYERDTETDLDFAQARTYANKLGRFTSADDFVNDTQSAVPGSWNLYVYVRNQPLTLTDPNGEQVYVGDIINPEDRETFLRRVNATYGCNGCVTVDSNGYLLVDTDGLSDEMREATSSLTGAINSTDQFFQVLVENNNDDFLFGRSNPVKGNVPIISSSGSPTGVRRQAIQIRLDFGDDTKIKGGSAADISSYLDTVFAHEVAHFSPRPRYDPVGRGTRGAVVNVINEILAVQGRPLRAEYGNFHWGTMQTQRIGDAKRDSTGKPVRGQDGIEVENIRVFVWIDRQKKDDSGGNKPK